MTDSLSGQVVAAAAVIVLTVAGCLLEFAQYYLKGRRSRNSSYLFAAAGFFLLSVSLLGNDALQPLWRLLQSPPVRFGTFLAGSLFLLGALVLFVQVTFLNPNRLQFEDRLLRDMPARPPEDQE